MYRTWQPLLDRLAAWFHLVAPEYPGFGHRDGPGYTEFAYTFDHQPPLPVVWGRYEPPFQVEQADVIADLTWGFPQRRQAHTDG